jgi:molybdopterin converting factor small subunit
VTEADDAAAAGVPVVIRLPSSLADVAGGQRTLEVAPAPATVTALLDALAADLPILERRLRDETGALRRFVNVYVDGEDVRHLQGLATALRPGARVEVLPSVAGG